MHALILAVPFTTFLAAFVALRGTNFNDFRYKVFKELGKTFRPYKKHK